MMEIEGNSTWLMEVKKATTHRIYAYIWLNPHDQYVQH